MSFQTEETFPLEPTGCCLKLNTNVSLIFVAFICFSPNIWLGLDLHVQLSSLNSRVSGPGTTTID